MRNLSIFVGTVLMGSSLNANPYSCVISENKGAAVHHVQFSRIMKVETDLTDYNIELSDYIGFVRVAISNKSDGKVVVVEKAGSDISTDGQPEKKFLGVKAEVPGILKVSCESVK